MKIKELREKKQEELERLLLEFSDKRQELNFKNANNQLKNIREIRNLKRDIARIHTILNEAKSSSAINKN